MAEPGSNISDRVIEIGAGPIGCYLIHGLSGSTYELQGLADYLGQAGYRVQARPLPGHGTTVEELKLVRADDWLQEVEFHFTEMLLDGEAAFVIGLSMGAGLALHLAALLPVAGVVAISPFLRPGTVRFPWLLPLAAPFIGTIPKTRIYKGRNRADQPYYGYDRYPVRTLRELVRLNRKIRGELAGVSAPLMVLHSTADITADIGNAHFVMDAVASDDKELVVFDEGGHILPDSTEKEAVWENIGRFIAAHLPEPETAEDALPLYEPR